MANSPSWTLQPSVTASRLALYGRLHCIGAMRVRASTCPLGLTYAHPRSHRLCRSSGHINLSSPRERSWEGLPETELRRYLARVCAGFHWGISILRSHFPGLTRCVCALYRSPLCIEAAAGYSSIWGEADWVRGSCFPWRRMGLLATEFLVEQNIIMTAQAIEWRKFPTGRRGFRFARRASRPEFAKNSPELVRWTGHGSPREPYSPAETFSPIGP